MAPAWAAGGSVPSRAAMEAPCAIILKPARAAWGGMAAEAEVPPGSGKAQADWLRQQAREHPLVRELVRRLPAFRGPKASHEPGLYVDAEDAPGVSVRREVRVSIARLFSANGADVQLVGQIQVTTSLGDPKQWALRFYVHAPTQFLAKEVHDHDAWWLAVLERHYARGGPAVAVFDGIAA